MTQTSAPPEGDVARRFKPVRIEDVLVPIDFSEHALHALDFAMALMSDGGQVHMVHVVDERFVERAGRAGIDTPESLAKRLTERAEARMRELEKSYNEAYPKVSVKGVVVFGTPFTAVLRLSNELAFQAIVIGTRGHSAGLPELLFGSTAERVIRGASIPVVSVPLASTLVS